MLSLILPRENKLCLDSVQFTHWCFASTRLTDLFTSFERRTVMKRAHHGLGERPIRKSVQSLRTYIVEVNVNTNRPQYSLSRISTRQHIESQRGTFVEQQCLFTHLICIYFMSVVANMQRRTLLCVTVHVERQVSRAKCCLGNAALG